MKEKEISIQASREEENGDEKRDSPTPPRTWASNNGGRDERKSKELPLSLSLDSQHTTMGGGGVAFSFIERELGLEGTPHMGPIGFFSHSPI